MALFCQIRIFRFVDELRRDRSGAGVVFGDGNANLEFAVGVVELQAAQAGVALGVSVWGACWETVVRVLDLPDGPAFEEVSRGVRGALQAE